LDILGKKFHAKAQRRNGRRKEEDAGFLCDFVFTFAPLRDKLI
jgi:hypothetical protein